MEEKPRNQTGKKPAAKDPLRDIAHLTEETLKQTEDAITARKKLTKQFLREIELEIREAIRMLKHLGQPWQHGDKTDYEFMRISLDKALTARKKERRDRLLQAWKDLLELEERKAGIRRELAVID